MPTDFEVTEAMKTYGGSFVKFLGQLHRIGDPENQRGIKAAWPELYRNLSSDEWESSVARV